MSLPTPAQVDAAVKAIAPAAGAQINILGFTLDASEIEAVVTVAIDALCMRAWKQAHAAGQAAAAAVTTEAQAEAAQRSP